mmetsp:Transcript_36559/g.79910  ORF Transcript_36559/g.79910 Transcript_36559/m.79910 type:complete len:123 (-) Transcript_36559:307-675(-)|eukprot:CAMPEP_0178483434 /NCGR_PEP_ID=MMETSP0696-20121128/7232_1 /TAXON_ID=265572 /ORGANISM="Extubocellulus spinifer, Strain CCMP396" /LENGTH=122 /DNA_ID=CAMNT_0020110951 /DNA_START=34 /DNA_END=402 /DNA_ORIENTATION=+
MSLARAASSKVPLVASQIAARSTPTLASTTSSNVALSTTAAHALDNLKCVLEEYRQVHYRQCMPSRFKKDLVKVIASDGIETLLRNIGAEERVSRSEIDTILFEAGSKDNKTIPANRMMHLI